MATLILGTLGRFVGGPVGGLIGTFIGSAVDRSLLGGRSREGPRLADLAVQSSAYGEPLPRLYGRLRVAGNIIWSSGISETATQSGGGKRGPRTTSYSYAASFAVALAAREIAGVGRIWADGKLLRDAAGAWVLPGTMRLHSGNETQEPDPLLASAEGPGLTPAYRGLAYAVFDALPLADYGNRIPNLTFEVIADAGDGVGLGTVLADLCGAAADVAATGFAAVTGFAAARAGSIRGQLETLAEIGDVTVTDDGARLSLRAGAAAAGVAVPETALGAGGAAREVARGAADAVPEALTLGFYDPSRDFQLGLQRAARRTPADRVEAVELPVALSPAAAKTLAAGMLARRAAARETAVFRLPWRFATVRAGALLTIAGESAPWRVRQATVAAGVVSLDVARIPAGAATGGAADGGRVLPNPDAAPGPTVLHALDLPPLPGETPTLPRLWLAAAGAAPGWRRADIELSADGGVTYGTAGTANVPAAIGSALGALAAAPAAVWDRLNAVEVELLADGMWLESHSETALLAGANLALLGDEVLQFAAAEALGARRFRLSGLLRGRRGSEAAAGGHAAGERFVLLEAAARLALELPLEQLGAALRLRARGAGDPAVPEPVVVTLAGQALRPLAPVHLRAAADDAGGLRLTWTRRSRIGFGWVDGADAPLGEETEAYRVEVRRGGAVRRSASVAAAAWAYPAAALAADGGAAGLTIAVHQISTAAGAGAAAVLPLA